ncbi:uncharacterized protein METZ01_LOCUS13734 [marine metagenome]|uniref:Uncharacterized protein n=1 Tax=marine metagenome TaxID=408172 RepID=A0A381P1Z6_9ZZZZ
MLHIRWRNEVKTFYVSGWSLYFAYDQQPMVVSSVIFNTYFLRKWNFVVFLIARNFCMVLQQSLQRFTHVFNASFGIKFQADFSGPLNKL